MKEALLKVENLKTHFHLKRGVVKAVDGVSFTVAKGQSVGLVGESGCGKTITSKSILRLEPQPAGKIVSGRILFEGEDLVKKSQKEMRRIRGGRISIIMQDPMTSLNPVYTVGNQIGEVVKIHTAIKGGQAVRNKVIEALEEVKIPAASSRISDFPHQMSGGMKQRAVGAMAICPRPSLLIADEPTTALDVTTQAQFLKLLRSIQQKTGISMLFITHDLGIVVKMCETVCVMYMGKVVERGRVREIWTNPRHPYTDGLIKSMPSMKKKVDKLYAIEGMVPSPIDLPVGCSFHPRCEFAMERCRKEYPPETDMGGDHFTSCWRVND